MRDAWSGNPDTDKYWAKEDRAKEEDILQKLGVDIRDVESPPIETNRETS